MYEKYLIYCAVGYFLYDFAAMAYYGLLDGAMTFHHWLCIIGMSLPLTYGVSANYIVQGMYIAEVSNPYMHSRLILKQYGLRYTKAYEALEISFMLLYIWGRFIMGSSVVWNTVSCSQNHVVVRLASACLMVQSLIFMK